MSAPYRVSAPGEGDSGLASRYVPMTRRQERLWRWLRSVPVVVVAGAGLYYGWPWLVGLAIVWGLVSIVSRRTHAVAINARLKALATSLARDGDPALAARALEAIVADARGIPSSHSVAMLFLAIARARGGDLDGALVLLHAVQRAGWLEGRQRWQAWLLPWLSQLHCARGDLEQAEAWLDLGRQRLTEDDREVLVSPAALLALRQGRYEEALVTLDGYADGDGATVDPVRDHFALLRAFAYERVGRPLPEPEARRVVAACVASPVRPLPLEKWWAELAAFVDRYRPAPRPSSSAPPPPP